MRGTVLSCCCLGALASPGCLGDPLVPALPRTVTPVLGLNHSLRHLRRTRGLEANARAKIKDRSRWLGAINRNGAPRAQPVTFGWALFAPYYPCPWTLAPRGRAQAPARRPEVDSGGPCGNQILGAPSLIG